MTRPHIPDALAEIRERIQRSCEQAGRDLADVQLVAVSKKVPPDKLAEALAVDQSHFGESYLQEALPKIAALPRIGTTWHFIGPIQGNKAADIARHFDWVHSVDRLKVAQRLSANRPSGASPLNICVQVNISGESSKSGVAPGEVETLCRSVASMPGVQLRGLMAIPAPLDTCAEARYSGQAGRSEHARKPYRQLRELFDSLREGGLQLDTLSAGMTDDFEAAIAEGSTMVRIGSAIFGRRL